MVTLIIDVGNTNAVFGIYKGDKLINLWRLATRCIATADELGLFLTSMINHWNIDIEDIEGVAISSVVPNVMYSLTHGVQKYIGVAPFIISPALESGINLDNMKNKMELGNDRLVDLVGAYEKYGGKTIVIDYGTATTYDACDENGKFLTGITAPGIKISLDALCNNTALLGNVAIKKPPSILTTDTVESIQAGVVFGVAGETRFIVDKMIEELEWNRDEVKVIATGGLAKVIDDAIDIFDVVDSNLTLDGTKIIFDKYRGKQI